MPRIRVPFIPSDLREARLTPRELAAWLNLWSRANREGIAWPSRSTLCRETRIGKDRLTPTIESLVKKGWLEVLTSGVVKGQKTESNRYRPLYPPGIPEPGHLNDDQVSLKRDLGVPETRLRYPRNGTGGIPEQGHPTRARPSSSEGISKKLAQVRQFRRTGVITMRFRG